MLQEFLRKLAPVLESLGIAAPSVAALGECANSLEPFKKFDLQELSSLLHRTKEALDSGVVSVAEVPSVAPLGSLSKKLSEDIHSLKSAEPGEIEQLEKNINLHRHQFQATISELSGKFGITANCSETPNWVGLVRAKNLVESIKPRLTSPESYREPFVMESIQQLREFPEPVLKQLGVGYGMTIGKGKLKSDKFVNELLTNLSGHQPVSDKPAKKPRADKPKADPNELIAVLKENADKVKLDPHALTDEQVDELVSRFKSFAKKDQVAIALAVTEAKAADAEDALLRVRRVLMGVRQQIDSQNA